MSGRGRIRRSITVRGRLVTELLGDPGPEGPLPGWRMDPFVDGRPPTVCPVCGRRIAADHLEHHLDCYDPDANCTVAEVAAWFGVDLRYVGPSTAGA